MMVMRDANMVWCVAATTASNSGITTMRRMIAVNDLLEILEVGVIGAPGVRVAVGVEDKNLE